METVRKIVPLRRKPYHPLHAVPPVKEGFWHASSRFLPDYGLQAQCVLLFANLEELGSFLR